MQTFDRKGKELIRLMIRLEVHRCSRGLAGSYKQREMENSFVNVQGAGMKLVCPWIEQMDDKIKITSRCKKVWKKDALEYLFSGRSYSVVREQCKERRTVA